MVAPARSATGRPILASDPHRSQSAPSLRYIVHLNAPGLNVIGGGEPALPGVSIGHNGTIAFGLTVFAIDQEDLYVYGTNPAMPEEYRYQGRWERMRSLQESIPVRGQSAQTVEMRFTRHGPVIHTDRSEPRLRRALRLVRAGHGAVLRQYRIHACEELHCVQARHVDWGAPAENQVYADDSGNIAWVAGGLAPKRPNWDGLLPVLGDGRYEWAGFWSGDQLPSLYNPEQGWIASANEQNLPPAYPYRERKLGFEWSPGSRHQRVSEVLASCPR